MGTKNKKMEMVEGEGGREEAKKKKRKKNSDVRVG